MSQTSQMNGGHRSKYIHMNAFEQLLQNYKLGIMHKAMDYTCHWSSKTQIQAPAHWVLREIDGLLVPPGKASKLLTDHLITGKPLKSEPAQEKWFSQTI